VIILRQCVVERIIIEEGTGPLEIPDQLACPARGSAGVAP
jgi:hypothetical protein